MDGKKDGLSTFVDKRGTYCGGRKNPWPVPEPNTRPTFPIAPNCLAKEAISASEIVTGLAILSALVGYGLFFSVAGHRDRLASPEEMNLRSAGINVYIQKMEERQVRSERADALKRAVEASIYSDATAVKKESTPFIPARIGTRIR